MNAEHGEPERESQVDARDAAEAEASGSLRDFLARLRESPAAQDRFIFDPVGLMREAGLTAGDQDVLLSGDADAINARVWPKGHVPRNGPIMTIDLVDSAWGPMPVVRQVHDYHVASTPSGPQPPNSLNQVVGAPCGFMGSVVVPHAALPNYPAGSTAPLPSPPGRPCCGGPPARTVHPASPGFAQTPWRPGGIYRRHD